MDKQEVLKYINKDAFEVIKVKEVMYHGKTYVLWNGRRIDTIYKTKRGAEGYIKREENFSYYDDYTQDMVYPNKGLEIFEIHESELIDINSKKLWNTCLINNTESIKEYNMGANLIYRAKDAKVNEETLVYIEESIKDIETTGSIERIQEEEEKPEIKAAAEKKETNSQISVTVNYNTEKNGIELKFSDKPAAEVLAQLHENGFRWSKYQKIWYAKDIKERREFIKTLLSEKPEKENKSIVNQVDYPEIDINDIDTYTVSKELSKRENDAHWVFRTNERDHQKELQNYLKNCNDTFIELIQGMTDKKDIYKAKKYLQHYKKAYYKNYIAKLTLDANNPSWIVTGRSGRSRRKDEQYRRRYDNLMRELCGLLDEYKLKVEYFKSYRKSA